MTVSLLFAAAFSTAFFTPTATPVDARVAQADDPVSDVADDPETIKDAPAAAHDPAPVKEAPAATPAAKKKPSADIDDGDDDDNGEKVDWLAPFTYYFSLEFDDDLHPEAEKNLVLLYVLAALVPYASAWGPFLFEEPGDGFLADTLLSWGAKGMVSSLIAMLFIIPIVGWVVGGFLLVVYSLVNEYYLRPVSTINMYSRSLKRRDAGLSHPLDLNQNPLPTSPRRKRGDDGDDDDSSNRRKRRVPESAGLPMRPTTAMAF